MPKKWIFVRNSTRHMNQDLECCVCLSMPNTLEEKVYAYSCEQHHIICEDCLLRPEIQNCPLCRQSFEPKKPARHFLAERLIRQFSESQSTPGIRETSDLTSTGGFNDSFPWRKYWY